MIPIYQILFYVFAAALLISALCVITVKNPVHAVLFLILCFFATAALWIMLQAEFLGLVLLFVYVGAVMTLFLFVVMMMNIDIASIRAGFARYLPFGIIALCCFVVLVYLALHISQPMLAAAHLPAMPAHYSNTKELGMALYTHYLLEFEVAGAILMVAIIAAISLAFFGRKPGKKTQEISKQVATTTSGVRLVKDMGPKS